MIATRLSRVPPFERGLTLGDFLVPIRLGERAAVWQRNLLLVAAGTLLIIAGAYISFAVPAFAIGSALVPVNPYVPLTLQTFGVLFAGALLGARRGFLATGLYLLLGAVGLPVFAAGADGVHAAGVGTILSVESGRLVLGGTGGYLLGFVLAGVLVGRLAELGWDRRLRGSITAMLLGSVVIYVVGLPWLALAHSFSVSDTLLYGLWPFAVTDLIKVLVAAALLPVGWRLVARRDHDL